MSAIRFMMLMYLIQNMDKVIARLAFVLVYLLITPVFLVLFHDGFASITAYKSPLSIYHRFYSILKWYYYNKDTVSTFHTLKIILIVVLVYMCQSFIWGIKINRIPGAMFAFVRRLISSISHLMGRSDGISLERKKAISEIEDALDHMIGYTLSRDSNIDDQESSLVKVKKATIYKIAVIIEEFMRNMNRLRRK